MSVSKQDWKDFQSNEWPKAKPALDDLMEAIGRTFAAMDTGDATEFLSYTEDDGKLMQAAMNASSAAHTALQAIRGLALEGNQRRFANKNAIAASEAAINGVEQYYTVIDLLVTGLVRGVRIEHDTVENDPAAIAQVKSGNLGNRLEEERHRVQDVFDFASEKIAALASVDKIGVL